MTIKTLKIIDLYSGVGGLSLGATKSNFDVACAVEIEQRISDSHKRNFPNTQHLPLSVSDLTGKSLLKKAKLGNTELAGLIGGPPCQGFSIIGKRKPLDERNNLFLDFFRLAEQTKPVFFLAENVPGILNSAYDEIRKNALGIVEGEYDVLKPIKINASEFGAATTRTRIFFIGVRKDVKGSERLLASIEKMKVPKPTFVKEALEGLPTRVLESWDNFSASWQKIKFDDLHFDSYVENLNQMLEGVGDSEAITRFEKKGEVSGCFATKHSERLVQRYASLEQGQQDKISKSIRLKNTGFCPTLRAGTDSTKGSFQAVRPIHPTEPRVITPREAARLQGFPDWFQFHETKWHSFRQIGNSVCPIAAQKVLTAIRTTLKL